MNNLKDQQFATDSSLSLPKKVGLIYSEVKREYFPTEVQYLTEKDALHDAQIIAKYLEAMGIKAYMHPGDPKLPERLRKHKPDLAINLVGSVKGNEYLSSTIPAVLELLEIPYTGAGILGESLSYNKFLIKKTPSAKWGTCAELSAHEFRNRPA